MWRLRVRLARTFRASPKTSTSVFLPDVCLCNRPGFQRGTRRGWFLSVRVATEGGKAGGGEERNGAERAANSSAMKRRWELRRAKKHFVSHPTVGMGKESQPGSSSSSILCQTVAMVDGERKNNNCHSSKSLSCELESSEAIYNGLKPYGVLHTARGVIKCKWASWQPGTRARRRVAAMAQGRGILARFEAALVPLRHLHGDRPVYVTLFCSTNLVGCPFLACLGSPCLRSPWLRPRIVRHALACLALPLAALALPASAAATALREVGDLPGPPFHSFARSLTGCQ